MQRKKFFFFFFWSGRFDKPLYGPQTNNIQKHMQRHLLHVFFWSGRFDKPLYGPQTNNIQKHMQRHLLHVFVWSGRFDKPLYGPQTNNITKSRDTTMTPKIRLFTSLVSKYISGGSRGGSMFSWNPPFEGLPSRILSKSTQM